MRRQRTHEELRAIQVSSCELGDRLRGLSCCTRRLRVRRRGGWSEPVVCSAVLALAGGQPAQPDRALDGECPRHAFATQRVWQYSTANCFCCWLLPQDKLDAIDDERTAHAGVFAHQPGETGARCCCRRTWSWCVSRRLGLGPKYCVLGSVQLLLVRPVIDDPFCLQPEDQGCVSPQCLSDCPVSRRAAARPGRVLRPAQPLLPPAARSHG